MIEIQRLDHSGHSVYNSSVSGLDSVQLFPEVEDDSALNYSIT